MTKFLVTVVGFSLGCLPALVRAQSAVRVQPLVVNADGLAGRDVGVKINAAIAACPRAGCRVELPAGQRYVFATKIVVPGSDVRLDCNGSTLVFAGAGDAVEVVGLNGDSPVGEIAHCTLAMAKGNAAGRNGIRQHSRVWMTYRNVTLADWVNPGSAGLLLDNDAGTGWPGYSERTHLEGMSFTNDAVGLRMVGSDGGTNSFGRTVFEGAFDLFAGQMGVSMEGGPHGQADVYGGTWVLHGNLNGTGGRLLNLANAQFRNTLADLEGEGSGGFLYYSDAASGLHLDGIAANSGGLQVFNGGTSDQVSMPLSGAGFVLQGVPFQNGQLQYNNSKVIWNGSALRYGMPRDYVSGSGYFQIYTRHTDTNPEVDAENEPGAGAQVNKLFCPWNGTGCGFGPGFGVSAGRGGVRQPLATVEVAGTVLSDSAMQAAAGADLDGMVQCGVYNVSDAGHAPAGSPSGLYVDVLCGAAKGYTVQHVFDAFANRGLSWTRNQVAGVWTAWVANGGVGLSTTVTLGGCVLTVENGLIVGKRGC